MLAKAATMWAIRKSGDFLKHQNKTFAVQNRKQHASISEKTYLETVKMESNKDFPYNAMTIVSASESEQELKSVFPELITNFVNACTGVPELRQRYTTLLEENVGKDKQAFGFLVNDAYKIFEAPRNVSPENIKLASILGWCCNTVSIKNACVQHMLTTITINDDIMESAEHRFGKPCWYKREDVGLDAINDTVLMENGIYLVLRKYFSGRRCYVPVADCFHEVAVKTAIGQSLNGLSTGHGKPRFEWFTMDMYRVASHHKIAYPAYIFPIALGMYLAGKYDPELHRQVNAVLSELGFFFAAQNDVLDCYGSPVLTGKESVDIARGTCTWLAVKAFEKAAPAQKEIFVKHYGKPESESVLKIRKLYDELGLVDEFRIYEKQSFDTVCRATERIPHKRCQEHFHNIAEASYEQKR